jgi:benzoate/toluate 1,2-dioxygenase alpha subunit/2,4,5-trichlorophenoxyacetic acid oxygenase 1
MHQNEICMLVEDRPEDGVFRVHPALFCSEEIFQQELRLVFGRTWNFLALASQLPKPNDFISTWIAQTPVLVTRNQTGSVGAFLNACRHKGAMLTRSECGNAAVHICPYHGWVYNASGKNVAIKDQKFGHYGARFQDENHDLIPLPRVDSYKGLIFGSLSSDVPPLTTFLGELRFFLDLALEQGPEGMEFVPGRSIYTYDGNWKLQMDNGLDQYHLTSTHTSFLEVQARRQAGQGNQAARQFQWHKRFNQEGGIYQFQNGHAAIWLNQAEVEKRPIYPRIDEIRKRKGDAYGEWALKLRNLVIFPNMQIADSTSLILRTFRPISVDRTEMRIYCMAPIGEPPSQRTWRIRQFEDFFNPAGFATPDDTATYEACQRGLSSPASPPLQGYYRGMEITKAGGDAHSTHLGFMPLASLNGSFRVQAETCLHPAYREWARLMETGMAGRKAYEAP